MLFPDFFYTGRKLSQPPETPAHQRSRRIRDHIIQLTIPPMGKQLGSHSRSTELANAVSTQAQGRSSFRKQAGARIPKGRYIRIFSIKYARLTAERPQVSNRVRSRGIAAARLPGKKSRLQQNQQIHQQKDPAQTIC